MPRIQLRQPAYAIMIAFLLGLQLTQPSRAWMILLVIFTGIFISAYLWTRSLGQSLHLRRETHIGWIQVGGQIEERITLSNTSLFPAPWVEFRDQSTLPDFNAGKITGIPAGHFDIFTIAAACNQRGLFTLGPAKILTGDPFGIFDVTISASHLTSILVLPQIATLPEIIIAPSGAHGDYQPRRNASEQTIHASTVREYAHGDSMRMIHWRTTARTKKLFVRMMDSAPEGNWWILLDLDQNNMLGAGMDSIEEQSIILAASLADRGLRLRKSVGLISNSKNLTWLTPTKGEGQRWEIMQALAVARPGRLDLSTTLERIQSLLGRQHSLIIITASTKPDWIKTLLPLAKRGLAPTVLLLDSSTYGGKVSAENVAVNLGLRGIKCHVIPHGMIQIQKTPAPSHNSWKWHSTPTGEIVPIRS